MDTNKKIKLPIIILNWNGFKDTEECVHSILKEGAENLIIYLIDNGSDKEDVDAIQKNFANHPSIKLIFNTHNLGFTKAHNRILKELLNDGHKYIFLLNNDTIAPTESIVFLHKYMKNGTADMLSCKLINYWDRDLMDTAGHKMLSSGEIIPIGHKESIKKYTDSIENIGACAGAALYSTEMLKDIGLFDEYFETGYEDAELGLRAYIAGYKCLYEANAIFHHKIGQSLKKVFDYKHALKTQVNIFYTYLKLVHWQVIAINSIPWILRLLIITLIGLVFLRFRYLKVLYNALAIILFKDWGKIIKGRKDTKQFRRIYWWQLLIKQEFFLMHDIQKLYNFILKGEKSYFEKY